MATCFKNLCNSKIYNWFKTLLLGSYLSPILLFLCALYPTFAFAITQQSGISYLFTSLLYGLPLLAILLFINNKVLYYSLVAIITICTLLEYTMVMLFDNYVLSGNILAVIMTDATEGGDFIKANASICWQWLPILLLSILSAYTYSQTSKRNMKIRIAFLLTSFLLPSLFVCYKLHVSYQDKLTYHYFIPTRIFNCPPYNVPYQIYNIVRIQQVKQSISEAEHFIFHATKQKSNNREVHVLAIGESMRFDKLSLNGYHRETTPCLDTLSHLISFNNYYSTACLTMFSVPQVVTRATPLNYEINYKEKGIVQPFKEVGFKTFVLVAGGNLLSYETYLTNGVDSLILFPNKMVGEEEISGDKYIALTIDSLIKSCDDNLFLILQFKGNHHPYTNFEDDFDVWKPNFKTASAEERANNDSLYINAYDNSMLYQDKILSHIIGQINKENIASTFTFVSDHGENITADGGGHGGDCSPVKTEYHVPFMFWCSDVYKQNNMQKVYNAQKRINAKLNADNIFYSLCDMASIELDSMYSHLDYSVFSDYFTEHERYVLLPDGINYILVE